MIAVNAAVELIDALGARFLMEPVDILRDDGKELPFLLPFGKLFVRRVGFGVQREHFIAVKAVKFFGVRIEVGIAQNCLGRDGIFLIVEPVLRAEVGDAALRRDARAAEKDDAGTV